MSKVNVSAVRCLLTDSLIYSFIYSFWPYLIYVRTVPKKILDAHVMLADLMKDVKNRADLDFGAWYKENSLKKLLSFELVLKLNAYDNTICLYPGYLFMRHYCKQEQVSWNAHFTDLRFENDH